MTNKKKILIETLHGSVAQLNELSSMTEGIDIYDETGHVDTDFLIEAISCVSAFMDASNIHIKKYHTKHYREYCIRCGKILKKK